MGQKALRGRSNPVPTASRSTYVRAMSMAPGLNEGERREEVEDVGQVGYIS